jgi:hypothetical protein
MSLSVAPNCPLYNAPEGSKQLTRGEEEDQGGDGDGERRKARQAERERKEGGKTSNLKPNGK